MVDKIKRATIEDSAVTQPKIAPGGVDNTILDKTAISGLTELSAEADSDDVLLIYDASADALKKVTKARTTSLTSPVYTSVTPSSVGVSTGSVSFTITGSGFTPGTNARLIGNGGQKRDFTSVTRNNTTTLTAVFDATVFSSSETPYDIQVINGEGIAVVGANQISFNEFPAFTTGAGSLGTGNGGSSVSFSVNATDPESAGNVTFELQSGSLPAGLSLTNTGANGGTAIISGTATNPNANTTSNFVLRAVDAASNTSSRAFSITINRVFSYSSFTSSGTFSVPSGVSVVDVLVVAGGGGSGANHAGGGGAGGLIFMPEAPVSAGGTVAITVGDGGAGGPAADDLVDGTPGQDSVFGASPSPGTTNTLTAKGGGGGGTGQSGNASVGLPGGSGGGASGIGTASPINGGAAIQATQPYNSGAYGFGNAGGGGVRPNTQNNWSGGGGGAGAAGEHGNQGGDGGVGKAYTIADGTTPVFYAGGGGGGRYALGYVQTQGGQGGGGVSNSPSGPATVGQANKGGGGGAPQQAGGKGIEVVRY